MSASTRQPNNQLVSSGTSLENRWGSHQFLCDRSWPWLWTGDYLSNRNRSNHHLPSRYLSILESNLPVWEDELPKPIFALIQERIKNAETQEEKLLANSELMDAQKANGVSPFGGIGCLPLLIQMPFFSALYFAAQYTPGISKDSFLGIGLGSKKSCFNLSCCCSLLHSKYALSPWYRRWKPKRNYEEKTALVSPIMIAVFSLMAPAGVTLYWVVGGFVQIIQQFVINYLIRPNCWKQVAEEYKTTLQKLQHPMDVV